MSIDLSRNELENMICIECSRKFKDHYKGKGTKFNLPELMTCMVKLQYKLVNFTVNQNKPPTD